MTGKRSIGPHHDIPPPLCLSVCPTVSRSVCLGYGSAVAVITHWLTDAGSRCHGDQISDVSETRMMRVERAFIERHVTPPPLAAQAAAAALVGAT